MGKQSKTAKPSATRNAKLSVPEAKKAISLLKGIGKSIAALRVFPDGGFVVITAGKAMPPDDVTDNNPWDRMFDAHTK